MAPVLTLYVEIVDGRTWVSERVWMSEAGAAETRAKRVEIAAKDFILVVE
jgi:hypothetical protein